MTSRPNCPVAPVTTILSEIVMFLLLVYNLGQALNKRPCDIAEGGRCDWSTRRMLSSFSDAGYLMPRLPHPRSCFFEQPELQRLLDDNLLQLLRLPPQILDLAAGRGTRRVARKPSLAGFQELLSWPW
jgi:hypothetical protein